MTFAAVWMFFLVFGVALYLIPTVIAVVRKPVNMAAAIVVNVLLGWSMIGWVVALVLSLGSTQHPQPYPYPPAGGYQPNGYPPPGAYHQGYQSYGSYGAPAPQPPGLPTASGASQPAWGTPSAHAPMAQPTVSDAPVEPERA